MKTFTGHSVIGKIINRIVWCGIWISQVDYFVFYFDYLYFYDSTAKSVLFHLYQSSLVMIIHFCYYTFQKFRLLHVNNIYFLPRRWPAYYWRLWSCFSSHFWPYMSNSQHAFHQPYLLSTCFQQNDGKARVRSLPACCGTRNNWGASPFWPYSSN